MMRARPGWIVAMSSIVIEFLPLQKVIAFTFSSSSFSFIPVLSQIVAGGFGGSFDGSPSLALGDFDSPGEWPARVPRALALEGARGLQHQIVALALRNDLHADRQPPT